MHNKKFPSIVAIFAAAIAVFSASKFAQGADNTLIISEVLVGGNSAEEEFIELYNPASSDIDLKSLPLKLHTVNSAGTDTSKTITYVDSNSIIKAHGYFLLASTVFKEKHAETVVGITYSASLVSNGAVYISTSATKNSGIIDLVCWGNSTKCAFALPDPKQNYSLEKIENGSDWQESCEEGGSPDEEAKLCEAEPAPPGKEAPVDTSPDSGNHNATTHTGTAVFENIFLNEILPNPKDDEEKDEFIEIVNGDNRPVDLFGWTIRDGSKSGKYVFKEHIEIKPGEYFALYRSQFKIALNNSAESVSLYNPQGELVSSVSYDKSAENASYGFDGKSWKWSKYLTPGKKNKFDSEPVVKINKPKNTYKDLYTEFSAKAKDKETKDLKYTWDFGDGKKSYLAKTSHKYLDTGKYTVTLSVSDDSQTVEKNFSIEVKKYPRPNIEITKIIPNPNGNDSESETIDIQNNSGQKIDLAGWKIATGSGEKIYNHPISGEISLDAGETKTITPEICKFSLNNKAGKIQLVMPDGKTIDEVEYSKTKIADNEAYAKIDGEWQWINSDVQDENTENKDIDSSDEPSDAETAPVEDENAGGEVLGATDEIETASYDPSFTSEDAFIFLSRIYLHNPPAPANYCSANNYFSNIAFLLASTI